MINYGHQCIEQDDIDAVVAVLQSDYLTQGPMVRRFEEAFAGYVGSRYAVACSSGTAALHIACLSAGIKEGSHVVTTPLTFMATANAVRMTGANPQFVDIEDDLNIHDQHAEFVLPVDFAGLPCDLDSFGGVVIEDGCHALGATYKGRKIGSISDMTCFSLHAVKAITTGEGGMVTTDVELYSQRLRCYRDHGRVEGESTMLGFNYRMTDIQAALGLSQLKKLDRFIERRRDIAYQYDRAFGLTHPPGHAFHLYVIQVDNRDELRQKLAEQGIGTQIHYRPLHQHRFYQGGAFPKAEAYYQRALSLPIYPLLKDAEVKMITEAVNESMGR